MKIKFYWPISASNILEFPVVSFLLQTWSFFWASKFQGLLARVASNFFCLSLTLYHTGCARNVMWQWRENCYSWNYVPWIWTRMLEVSIAWRSTRKRRSCIHGYNVNKQELRLGFTQQTVDLRASTNVDTAIDIASKMYAKIAKVSNTFWMKRTETQVRNTSGWLWCCIKTCLDKAWPTCMLAAVKKNVGSQRVELQAEEKST